MRKYSGLAIFLSLFLFSVSAGAVDTWVEYPRFTKTQDIAVGPNGKVFIVSDQLIQRWDIGNPQRPELVPLGDKKNKIIISNSTGDLRAIKDGKVAVLDQERLEFLTGIVSQIAIDTDGNLWAVTINNNLYKHAENIWQRVPGKLSDIAIGVNGQVWGLGDKLFNQGGYPVLKLSGGEWQDTGGISYEGRLAVDANGEAWILGRITKTGTDYGIFRSQNGRWEAMPAVDKPRYIASDQAGTIWVSGNDKTYKRIPALFKWQGGNWKENFHHAAKPFGFMPGGNPIFPGFYIVESKVPRKINAAGTSYTANLSVISFTLDKNDVVWAIRSSGSRGRIHEILTWDGERFETAIETKKLWEYSNDQLVVSDWPSDIVVDETGSPWILANSQLYRRQNNGWVKADDRNLIDIISSPKGEIWALEVLKTLGRADPFKKTTPSGRTIFRWNKDKLTRVGPDKSYVYKVAVDNNDVPWILARDLDFKGKGTQLAVFRLEKDVWVKVPIPEPFRATTEFGNGVDGSLWLGAMKQTTQVLLKWNGQEWKKYNEQFMAYQINGDSSGHPVGIIGGGFVTTNVKQFSATKPTLLRQNKQVRDVPKKKINTSDSAVKKLTVPSVNSRAAKTIPPKPRLPQKKKIVAATTSLAGCWRWSNGSYVVINDKGMVSNGLMAGKWTNAEGQYSITWPSVYDNIKLTENGKSFAGRNSFGAPVSGKRISGNARELVGQWIWFNGIPAVISEDKTVKGGGFEGVWKKLQDGFSIEWPIVDLVKLSATGSELKGSNQFGPVMAIRDGACAGP